MYCVDCICGHPIESEASVLTCAHCQRVIVIEWRARDNSIDRPAIIRGLKFYGRFESAPTGSIGEEQSTT